MQNRKQWEDEFELEHGLGRGPIEELIMSAARQAHARGREEERTAGGGRRERRWAGGKRGRASLAVVGSPNPSALFDPVTPSHHAPAQAASRRQPLPAPNALIGPDSAGELPYPDAAGA